MKTVLKLSLFGLAVLSVCYGQGVISTIAGNGTLGDSGDGGPAIAAGLKLPTDMAIDSAGNIYIVDYGNNVIRKVDTTGKISTFAGNGTADYSGVAGPAPGDGGPATSAEIPFPTSVAVDKAGNVFIANVGAVRKVDTSGNISTAVALSGVGLAVDSAGNLYITDTNGTAIHKLSPGGVLSLVAGGVFGFSGDGGLAIQAAIAFPSGVAVDAAGNVYFADKANNRVRKVDTAGIITTVAGSAGTPGFTGDGGPATSAKLGLNLTAAFQGVAVDSAGNLYIADPRNNRVRIVNTAGIITTYAGNGNIFQTAHGDGGPPAMAGLSTPYGVRVDNAGNIFIADTGDNIIRKVTGAATTGGSGPTISSNGVVNGASFQPGIAANSWVTIQGGGFTTKTDDWINSIINGELPTSLDGVSVTMEGKPAYISYISPGQLNVLSPDLSPGPVSVVVTTPAGSSTAVMTTAGLYGPAFFLWPASQVIATHQDYSLAVKAGTFAGSSTVAAKPGEVLILWATGFGPTNPATPTGVAVPGDKVYSTVTLPAVSIDNIPALVYGAALSPGSVGLYQIAIQVPLALADGDWPIQASIGGVASPGGATLTVQR